MTVADEVFELASNGLFTLNSPQGRLRGFFVRRRAEDLVRQNAAAPDKVALSKTVIEEQKAVSQYLRKTVKRLVDGPDPAAPKHFDLADVSKVYSQARPAHGVLKAEYERLRLFWVVGIVWRAAAIHAADLWKTATATRELETRAFDLLVDHRLRAVETMHYLINAGGQSGRSWSTPSANGPWTDGYRVRVVEYPGIPKSQVEGLLAELKTRGWKEYGGTLKWIGPNGLDVKVTRSVEASWRPEEKWRTDWIRYDTDPAVDPLQTLDAFFSYPRENYLDRSYLYCDMVVSGTLLASYAHAWRRRDAANSAFKDAFKPHYVRMGPVVQPARWDPVARAYRLVVNLGELMADGPDDPFFENSLVDFDDLQVGDHVCFWSNKVYLQFENGAWGNEFSLVMNVDPDPATGRIPITGNGPRMELAGHGIHTCSYSAMALDLSGRLGRLLTNAANNARLAGSATQLESDKFVKWAPYEDFDPPNAWWLKLPRDVWEKAWGFNSLSDAADAVPRTIFHNTNTNLAIGYRPPPDPDALYFPLFEPRVGPSLTMKHSWQAYLDRRAGDPAYRAPTKLDPLMVDADLAMGLFFRGSKAKIPTVRPRVIK